ncbi:hypothetical protein ACFQJD_05860 [Haloplanus sp. GCM10025708]|uniref:hypothetical protein n=1 Tax=Haloplanus sp. GCM10025708 TaxID=3252679 RepID=UPI003622C45E
MRESPFTEKLKVTAATIAVVGFLRRAVLYGLDVLMGILGIRDPRRRASSGRHERPSRRFPVRSCGSLQSAFAWP